MYLKRSRRHYKGEDYESWSLVQSVRTARGPRQRVVATLGKLPGLTVQSSSGKSTATQSLKTPLTRRSGP